MNILVITYVPGLENEVRDFLGLLIPSIAISFRVGSRGVWQIQTLLSAGQVEARLSQWTSDGETLSVRQINAAEAEEFERLDDWLDGQIIAPFAAIAGHAAQARPPLFRFSV
jgi:hypothetical protein